MKYYTFCQSPKMTAPVQQSSSSIHNVAIHSISDNNTPYRPVIQVHLLTNLRFRPASPPSRIPSSPLPTPTTPPTPQQQNNSPRIRSFLRISHLALRTRCGSHACRRCLRTRGWKTRTRIGRWRLGLRGCFRGRLWRWRRRYVSAMGMSASQM